MAADRGGPGPPREPAAVADRDEWWGPYGGEGGLVVRIRLLGPVDVVVHDHPQQVRGLRRKAVLAVLALHGREIVRLGGWWRRCGGGGAADCAEYAAKPRVVSAQGFGEQGRDRRAAAWLCAGRRR